MTRLYIGGGVALGPDVGGLRELEREEKDVGKDMSRCQQKLGGHARVIAPQK